MLLVDRAQEVEVVFLKHPAPHAVVDLHDRADLPAGKPVDTPHNAAEPLCEFGAFSVVHGAMRGARRALLTV